MKSVFYISTAVRESSDSNTLSGVPQILIPARKYNKANGLSGMLGVQDGFYLHLLQGPSHAVDVVLERIRNDRRHQQIFWLVNAKDQQVDYGEFSLKLSSPRSDNRPLLEFMDRHRDSIESRAIPIAVQKVLREFGYSNSRVSVLSQVANEVGERQLRLKQWPDFDVIDPVPKHLDACAALIKGWLSVDVLVNQVFGGDKTAADRFLDELSVLEIMLERHMGNDVIRSEEVSRRGEPRQLFLGKMKSFLKGQLSGLLR